MYSQKDFDLIKKIVLKKIENTKFIYLFGSYALSEANKESDIDIAILLEKQIDWKERKNILNYLYRETSKNGLEVDFVVKTESSFNEEKLLPTLAQVIHKEGKILWKMQ